MIAVCVDSVFVVDPFILLFAMRTHNTQFFLDTHPGYAYNIGKML